MLIGHMARSNALPGLLTALLAIPLVAGCSVLGLSATGAGVDAQPAAGVDGGLPAPSAGASPSFFSSNDGYALTVPVGWVVQRTNANAANRALDALSGSDATLASEASSILDDTGARMSMMGLQANDLGDPTVLPPGIAILVMPTNGASDADTQQRVGDIIGGLPTVDGTIEHHVISVAAGDAHRYDLLLQGDSLSVQLRLYLFTVGDDGVLVLFGSDPSLASQAGPDMDSIVKSLRFGV
jgi:hypothetical protein